MRRLLREFEHDSKRWAEAAFWKRKQELDRIESMLEGKHRFRIREAFERTKCSKNIVWAHCHDCAGDDFVYKIRYCVNFGCKLWNLRPYQTPRMLATLRDLIEKYFK